MTTQISTKNLPIITHQSVPVITTELLAKLYATEANNIKVSYSRNIDRFLQGKHFFKLEDHKLGEFKNRVT